jgi:hypothetical protein
MSIELLPSELVDKTLNAAECDVGLFRFCHLTSPAATAMCRAASIQQKCEQRWLQLLFKQRGAYSRMIFNQDNSWTLALGDRWLAETKNWTSLIGQTHRIVLKKERHLFLPEDRLVGFTRLDNVPAAGMAGLVSYKCDCEVMDAQLIGKYQRYVNLFRFDYDLTLRCIKANTIIKCWVVRGGPRGLTSLNWRPVE